MRQVSEHVFAEFYFWGCNPGYLVTSDGVLMIDTPQQPIDAVRWRERLLEHGPIRYLVNTEPHIDHISGNAYFPGAKSTPFCRDGPLGAGHHVWSDDANEILLGRAMLDEGDNLVGP